MALSCSKDKRDTLASGMQACGELSGDAISTDEGLTLRITEVADDLSREGLKDGNRLLVIFDVLTKLGEKSYEIRLKSYATILCKPCVEQSELAETDTLGTDPIYIVDGWSSGGYMNLRIAFPYLQGSGALHLINLVHLEDVGDTLCFSLRHNGHGYGSAYPSSHNGYMFYLAYTSFPVSKYIPSDREWSPVKVTSSWFLDTLASSPISFTGMVSR